MRTIETDTMFRREMEHCLTPQARAAARVRQEAYDERVDRMIVDVQAIEPHSQRWACELLERLGGPHCLSGMPEFGAACVALERMGVTAPNQVFEHDRRYIAATYLPAKTKETA